MTQRKQWVMTAGSLLLACGLAGCGAGAGVLTGTSESPAPLHMMGSVYGGQQPIADAAVYLYATGTSGYGSTSISLLETSNPDVHADGSGHGYVLTDADGDFTITGDYSCPTGAMVYLLAIGGNPGLADDATNPDAELMLALGSCSFLQANASTTVVNVNEVTTVASVWALAPFMNSATAIGTSSAAGSLPGNASGLANAFATVNNLVNPQTGTSPGAGQPQAGGTFAGLPAGMSVPSAEIYSLANVLASCINSDPASSSNCSTLFDDAPSATGVVPANTVQAALNMAQNPGVNVATLFGLSTPTPAFAGGLDTAPNDWTIGIRYSGDGINFPYNIAVDSQGNVWTANSGAASDGIVILGPGGGRLSTAGGYTSGGISAPFAIALDASDHAWVTNTGTGANSVSCIDINGNALNSSPITGGGITSTSSPHGIAVDGSGNVWVSNQHGGEGSVTELSSTGSVTAGPIQLQGVTSTSQPFGVTVDPTERIWITNRQTNSVTKLVNATTGSNYGTGHGFNNPFSVAIDGTGYGWVTDYGTNAISYVSNTGVSQTGSPYAYSQLANPSWISIDGLGKIWVANLATTNANSCISELDGAGNLLSPVCYALGNVPGAHGMAIDTAGNLWVGGSTVTQLVGLVAPVITPLVTATIGSHLGVRP